MAATALFKEFGPFFNGGSLATSALIYHYVVGTTTTKACWTDRTKITTAAQPLQADINGIASAYFDGLYKIVVKTSDGATTLATWDQVQLLDPITSTPATWTPSLSCLTPGDLAVTYAYQQGQVVQVGDMTWLSGNLICTPTYTTATGAVQITGATYGHTGNVTPIGCCTIVNASGAAAYKSHSATIDVSKIIKINKVSHDVFTPLNITDFTTAAEIWIYFSIMYEGV